MLHRGEKSWKMKNERYETCFDRKYYSPFSKRFKLMKEKEKEKEKKNKVATLFTRININNQLIYYQTEK